MLVNQWLWVTFLTAFLKAYTCWTPLFRQKLLGILWFLWEQSFVFGYIKWLFTCLSGIVMCIFFYCYQYSVWVLMKFASPFFSFLSVFDITILVISFVFITFYKKEILTSRSDKTNRWCCINKLLMKSIKWKWTIDLLSIF